MKHVLRTTLFILFCIPLLGAEELVNKVVAVVNDEIVTLYELKTRERGLYAAMSQKFKGKELDDEYAKAKKSLLDAMINEKLLSSKGRELNLDPNERFGVYVENTKKENNLKSDGELKQALEAEGIKFDDWKKMLLAQILQQMVLEKGIQEKVSKIENAEQTEYYEEHKEDFTSPPEYDLLAIYVGKTTEKAEEKKAEIDKELAGGKEFTQVAGQLSEEPLKSKNGELGNFKKEDLDPILLKDVAELAVGSVSGWIDHKEGWFKVKMKAKKEPHLAPFKEVQERVYNTIANLRQEAYMRNYVEQLKKEGHIKVYSLE